MVAMSKGVELYKGFSAMELFKKINNSYRPCEEMFEAVVRVKQSGESVWRSLLQWNLPLSNGHLGTIVESVSTSWRLLAQYDPCQRLCPLYGE